MRLLIIILGILIVLLTLISRLRPGLLAAIAGGEPTLSLRIGPASIHLYPPRKEAPPAAHVPEKPKEIRVKKKVAGKLVKPGFSDLRDAWTTFGRLSGGRWHEPGEGSASIRWTSLSQ